MKIPIWVGVWVIAFSLLAAVLVAWDKGCARRGDWRVSERTLWTVAALGGSAVMWMVCVFTHHKTRRVRFMFGLPVMVVVQALVLYVLLRTGVLDFAPMDY